MEKNVITYLGILNYILREKETNGIESECKIIRQDIRLINLLSNSNYRLNSAGYFYGYEDKLEGFKELFSNKECLKFDVNVNRLENYLDNDYIFRLKNSNKLLIVKESGIIKPNISNGCEMTLSSKIIPIERGYLHSRYRFISNDVDIYGKPIVKSTKCLSLYINQNGYPLVDYVNIRKFNNFERYYFENILKEMTQEEIIERILNKYNLDLGKLKETEPKLVKTLK